MRKRKHARKPWQSRSSPAIVAGGSTCAHGPAVGRDAVSVAARRCGRVGVARARAAVGTTAIDDPGNSPALVPTAGAPAIAATSRPPARWISSAVVAAIASAAVGRALEPVLDQIRAEVGEQQQAAQQEERDDQDRRDEADEDVGDDQLAPDAPQQALRRERQPAADEVDAADRPAPTDGEGIEDAEQRAGTGATRPSAMTIASFTAAPSTIARPGQRSETARASSA